MIKKIFPTEFDLFNLSLKRTLKDNEAPKTDYKGVVVNKPWGYEYLMFQNNQVAVWILFLDANASTSMHCHPRKKTSLTVLEGNVRTSSLDTHFELNTLDGLIIDRGVFHSTRAVTKEGAFIMEIETPPQKNDLVRLKDEYGRESQGYEGESKITSDVKSYEYTDFHASKAEERCLVEKIIKQRKIVLHLAESWESFYKEIQSKKICVISFLDTPVKNLDKQTILEIGETVEGKWFLDNFKQLKPPKGTFQALTIH